MKNHATNVKIYNFIQSKLPKFFEPLENESAPHEPYFAKNVTYTKHEKMIFSAGESKGKIVSRLESLDNFYISDYTVNYDGQLVLEIAIEDAAAKKKYKEDLAKYKEDMKNFELLSLERKAASERNKARIGKVITKYLPLWRAAGKYLKDGTANLSAFQEFEELLKQKKDLAQKAYLEAQNELQKKMEELAAIYNNTMKEFDSDIDNINSKNFFGK